MRGRSARARVCRFPRLGAAAIGDRRPGQTPEAQRRAHPEGKDVKSCDKVRITAQLIKSADGSPRLWSESDERTLDDIFAVQEDIEGEVVRRCRSRCSARRSRHVPSPRTRRRTTSPCRGGSFSSGAAGRTSSVQSSNSGGHSSEIASYARPGRAVGGERAAGRQRLRAGRRRRSTGARGCGEGAGTRSIAR